MQRLAAFFFGTLFWATFLSPFATAQGDAKPAEPQAKTATPAQGETLSSLDTKKLSIQLTPMTKDEVGVEAKAWLAAFTKAAQDITAEETKETPSADTLTSLRNERDGIRDRVDIVLAAWTARGGDEKVIEEHQKYLAAASGFVSDWFDLAAVGTAISGWLVSDNGGIKWGINIALFLLTIFVFRILAGIIGKITKTAVNRMKSSSDLLRKFCINFATKFTTFIGLIVALSVLGVNIGPFLAVLGAAGFIIGFALQGTLNNFAAGIMILIYRPFDVGNVITAAGVTGKVEAMTMSSTTIKTPDNQVIIVPNGSIWGGIITNVTGSDTRRVDLVFGIGYSDDIGKAQAVLEELVAGHEKVLKDPAPVIKVHELADSSVNFICRPWSKTKDYWDVYWDLTRSVKERFDAADISIPFPQTDVHIHQVAAPA